MIDSRGRTIRFGDDEQCVYRTVAAYLRALSCQRDYPERTPAVLREMVDAALAGQWLGQRSGDQLWGSNLYLQTVSAVLNMPMPWELAATAAEAGLISLDGAVVGLPQPVRAAPVGPVMEWDSNQESDGDWVVWWARLDARYQVEVTRHPDNTSHGTMTIYDHANNDSEIHTEQVSLAYGAVFGPDTGDVDAWMARAVRVADEHGG